MWNVSLLAPVIFCFVTSKTRLFNLRPLVNKKKRLANGPDSNSKLRQSLLFALGQIWRFVGFNQVIFYKRSKAMSNFEWFLGFQPLKRNVRNIFIYWINRILKNRESLTTCAITAWWRSLEGPTEDEDYPVTNLYRNQ